MTTSADKTDPLLWEKVKHDVTEGGKGGKPGQWSARKAQMAVQEYKAAGGGYEGEKSPDNHLVEWEREDWDTKSGKPSAETGERYLPKQARAALSDGEYRRTTDKKRADTAKGRQFSAQPADIAGKTAASRRAGASRAELLRQAAGKGVKGRTRMTKAQLQQVLDSHG